MLVLCALLTSCRPAAPPPPPPDFTTLKRDLLELDQAVALDRRTALVQPDRFIRVLEQLERDLRLQRDKPTGLAQTGVEALLANARLMRQAGAEYARYAAIYHSNLDLIPTNPTAEGWWGILKTNYLAFHPSPTEDNIDVVVRLLEAAETAPPPAP